MSKSRVLLVIALLAVMFAVGMFTGHRVTRLFGLGALARNLNTATVIRQVQTLSQLVTVQFVMEKIVPREDVKWYGESRVLLVAHGVVKAGVDLQELKPSDVRIEDKTVTVRLPQAKVFDAYLNDSQTKVLERSTGLLRSFDKNLEQDARQAAIWDISRSARNAGILKEADRRAREQLSQLLKTMGFEKVEFAGP